MYFILIIVLIFIGYKVYKKYSDNKVFIETGLKMFNEIMKKHNNVDTAKRVNNSIFIEYVYQGETYTTVVPFNEDYFVSNSNKTVKFDNKEVKIQPGTALRVSPRDIGSKIEVVDELSDRTTTYEYDTNPNFFE
jgi:hypothetical protein